MPTELIVFFTSMIPFLEMKLSIPLGVELGLPSTSTFLFATAGTIIPAAIALLIIDPVTKYLRKKSKYFDTLFEKLFQKTRKEHSKNFKRYGAIFFILLIATPLPGSGATTAALIAFLFAVPFWEAMGLISLGVMGAALILTTGIQSLSSILHLAF